MRLVDGREPELALLSVSDFQRGNLMYVVSIAYGESKQLHVQNKRDVLLGDVDPFYMSDEKERAGDSASNSKNIVERTGQRGLPVGWADWREPGYNKCVICSYTFLYDLLC